MRSSSTKKTKKFSFEKCIVFYLDEVLDAVDDVTVGYEGAIPAAEIDLLKGHIPKAVHFHVKRYNTDDSLKTDEEIGEWLKNCWDEKEDRLKE